MWSWVKQRLGGECPSSWPTPWIMIYFYVQYALNYSLCNVVVGYERHPFYIHLSLQYVFRGEKVINYTFFFVVEVVLFYILYLLMYISPKNMDILYLKRF